MPWEIDYAMLSFIQLKKSAFYFPEDYTIKIDTCLNLSSHLINWKETKFPKQYFIDKFNDLHLLLDRYDDLGPFHSDIFSIDPKKSISDSFIPFFNRMRDELININNIYKY